MDKKLLGQEFYTYGLVFSGLANGTQATGVINIEADSYFKVQKLTYFADIALAAQTDSSRIVPLVTVSVTDTGSGRQLMNEAQPIPALFGTGELPFILPTPKIFKPRTSLSITIANFSSGSTYNVRLLFNGAKLWYS